jgi:MFS family permease
MTARTGERQRFDGGNKSDVRNAREMTEQQVSAPPSPASAYRYVALRSRHVARHALVAVPSPWRVFALLAVAQFMVVLDTSIVYVALPSIQVDLGFSTAGLAWVMNAYILAFGGFMLLFGRATDLFGRRRVLVAGLILFMAASIACGLSTEPWQIVAARTLQGLAAAAIAPSALALVTDLFSEGPDRHKAFGIWGGLGGIAGATGTFVGGLLTTISWEWTFWVNVPITVLILVLGRRMLPVTAPTATGRLDVAGAVTSTLALCLLLYAVLHAGQGGPYRATLGVLAVAIVLLGLFVLRQRTAAEPLIPSALLRARNVTLGNAANAATGALLFGIFFVMTLHLQLFRHLTPLEAGLATMPISLALFAGSNLAIRAITRVTPVTALAAGLAGQAVVLGWWSLVIDPEGPFVTTYLLPGTLWGLAQGVSIVAGFVVCTSGLDGPIQGAASGAVSTSLQVGGAVGVAVLTSVTTWQAAAGPSGLAHGQPAALLAAGAIAVFGVAVMLVLRRVWGTSRVARH